MEFIIKSIPETDRLQVIKNYFETDPDLISTYHVHSGKTLDECAIKTHTDLNTQCFPDMSFYEIKDIGFYGIENNNSYLTTIFIKPEHRNKQDIMFIWNNIKKNLNSKFHTGIYKKNTRALNFYLKNGGKILTEAPYENNMVVILEFKEQV